MSPKDLKAAALSLPSRARARLAASLIESLDRKREPHCEEAWLDEAERRYRAYKEGKTKVRPAAEVLRDARRKLG